MPHRPGPQDLLTGGITVNDEDRTTGKHKDVHGTAVSEEDIRLIKKVHKIVDAGKNVEIKKDKNGNLKLLQVSKELA